MSDTVRAIVVHETGGREVLREERVPLPPPARGEARVRHRAIGVNFIDVYHRIGLYPLPLPFVPGVEAAGVVEAIGEGVTDVRVGDRVGYASAGIGAYAEARNAPAAQLVPIPDAISDETAAAAMLKGFTARYLLHIPPGVSSGTNVLLHAAAGGVGTLVAQWASHLGANVIGVVSSDAKAEVARAHGCAHVIVSPREDFVARARALTGGRGVDVVLDSVGKDTFMGSLDALRPRGLCISFGQSSGKVPPFELLALQSKGSLMLTRPTLFHFVATRPELLAVARDTFDVVARGVVRVPPPRVLALADVAKAQEGLESRATTGATVLVP